MTEDSYLMRSDLEDTYGILELQNKILQIMQYIDEFCRENEITYWLMGGSALGAKRHGGFIPWDDDLDIFMTVEEYNRFRELFEKKGDKERFYLQEQGAIDGMVRKPKLRMNGTTYIESGIENLHMHHGIFVDIFLLHHCPDKLWKQKKQYLWSKYIVLKALSNQKYKKRTGGVQLVLSIVRLFPKNFLLKKAYKELYRYDGEETNWYCHFVGKPMFSNGRYRKDIFVPEKMVQFETLKLPAPGKLEEFLQIRYGDYMKVPSQDKMKYDQHAKKWDTKIPFQTYVNPESDYSDENMLI